MSFRPGVFVLLLALASCATQKEIPKPSALATVFLWSNLQSETEPCKCSLRPLGGMKQRFEKIKELSKEGVKPIFIDAGRSLFFESENRVTSKDLEQATKISSETSNALGSWVLLLGDLDLRAPASFFKKMTEENSELKLVLSNAELFEGEQKISADFVRHELSPGKSLWLLSMLSPDQRGLSESFKSAPKKSQKNSIHNPADSLARFFREADVSENDLIIIGGSLEYDEILELAAKHPNRRIVFAGSKFSQHRMSSLDMGEYKFYVNEKGGKNFWLLELGQMPLVQILRAEIFQVFDKNKPVF